MFLPNYQGSRVGEILGLAIVAIVFGILCFFVSGFWLGFFTLKNLIFALQSVVAVFTAGFVLAALSDWVADMLVFIGFFPWIVMYSDRDDDLEAVTD